MIDGWRQFPLIPPVRDKEKRILYLIGRMEKRELYTRIEMPNRVFRNVSQVGSLNPKQFLQATSADLEDSVDESSRTITDSVLLTASENLNEFNWKSGEFESIVVLGPGDGTPAHPVIIDFLDDNIQAFKVEVDGTDYKIVPRPVCRPFGTGPTKLQFGHYIIDSGLLKFQPVTVAVGTWIRLEQKHKSTGQRI